ncbi:hypothetical protein ACLKA6_010038 [Drosophila palustris]
MDSELITKLWPSSELLGYAGDSTKALSAGHGHDDEVWQVASGSITCRRRCMKLHMKLSYDTCLIAGEGEDLIACTLAIFVIDMPTFKCKFRYLKPGQYHLIPPIPISHVTANLFFPAN